MLLTLSGPGSFWAPTSGGGPLGPPLPKITLGQPFWTKLGTTTKFGANFQKNLIWHHLDHLWRHKLMTSLLMTSSVTSTYDFTIFDVIEWRHDDGSGQDLAKIFVSSVCNTCPSLRSFEIPSDDFWPHESSNLTLLGVPKIRGSDLIVLPKFRTGDPGWIFFLPDRKPRYIWRKVNGFLGIFMTPLKFCWQKHQRGGRICPPSDQIGLMLLQGACGWLVWI